MSAWDLAFFGVGLTLGGAIGVFSCVAFIVVSLFFRKRGNCDDTHRRFHGDTHRH